MTAATTKSQVKRCPPKAHSHRSSAIGTDRRAVRTHQLRAVLSLHHPRSPRRNDAPLGTCVTKESATGDGVLDEEQPVGDTSAQGYYRAPALPFPGVSKVQGERHRLALVPKVAW